MEVLEDSDTDDDILPFFEFDIFVNTIFAGRLDDSAKLAGVGLGYTILNVICIIPLLGMNGTIETLVSQAFGAKNLELCGVYLNRGRVINTLIFIPLAIALCFT